MPREFDHRPINRRQLLRSAGTATLLTAGLGSAAVLAAPDASAVVQFNWWFCDQCRGIVFMTFRNTPGGVCSATGGAHRQAPRSWPYSFRNTGSGQTGWRYCNKCRLMFYGGSTATGGACAAGGRHDGRHSYNYRMWWSGGHPSPYPQHQTGWHWCTSCAALVWQTDAPGNYECPVHVRHTRGSRSYSICIDGDA